MDYSILFDSKIKGGDIEKWRKSGKKALGVVCCHVPFELLHAAEILPVRLRATGTRDSEIAEDYMSPQNCCFTKCVLKNMISGLYDLDGIVCSDGCSVASTISSAWETVARKAGKEQFKFQISVPRMNNASSAKYFAWELEDLKTALEEFSGNKISDEKLKHSIDTYNEARRLVRRVYDLHLEDKPRISGEDTLRITLAATERPIEDYIELVRAFLADVENRKPIENPGRRVMLVGSALDDPEFVRAVEDNGCMVVADLNSFGIRFLHDELPYDEGDLMGSISRYYMPRAACPRMMDGSDTLHEYVFKSIKEFRAEGVIFEKLKYCDKWDNESYQMGDALKAADIPYLIVERQEQLSAEGQLSIRVEAFKELLEIRDEGLE